MKLEAKNLLQMVLVVITIIQISSWILSQFNIAPLFKLGQAILLIILASAMTVIIGAGFKFDRFDKFDLLYLFVLIGLMVLAYIYLPQYYPEIFSTIRPEIFSTINP
jgi:uncharacterized membrane protein